MMKKFIMEKPMVPKTQEMVCKHKPVSTDFWAFLEEIDAPQWVDFALEGPSNCREWDDSWFHTVHPFHQKSFHDLVSASPLAVQTKGKVSKPVRFNPGIANSVSKSRGKKQWSRNKVAGIPIDLSAVNKPHNCQTRLAGAKPSSSKPIDNVNTGRSACLHKSSDTASTFWSQIPSIGNELKHPRYERVNLSRAGGLNNQSTEACLQMLSKENKQKNQIDEQVKSSTVGGISNQSAEACSQIRINGNELTNQIDEQVKSSTGVGPINQSAEACSQMPSKGNELKNPIDVQVKSSGIDDLNSQSTVVEIRAPISRTTGLLSMLKMASLRRSCGMLPMRVEVKDIQQPKDRKSSNKISTGSLGGSNRQTSSLGSISNNSQQVKKEDKIKLLKNHVRSSTISPIEHNRKKSSIGSSSIVEKTTKGCEAAVTKIKPRETSKEVGRKQGQPIGEVSRELGKSQGQLIGGRNCDGVLSMRTKTSSRRPLQDVHNVGPSQRKVGILRNQRLAGKENNYLETIQNQKVNRVEGKKPLTTIKGTLHDQRELKVPAQPKAESTIHSIKDIKQWEKNSGRSYFSLSQMQREKVNREILISKYRYR